MTRSKKSKTEQEKQTQKTRTTVNQIKRYEKALKTASGKSREEILKKLEYYKSR